MKKRLVRHGIAVIGIAVLAFTSCKLMGAIGGSIRDHFIGPPESGSPSTQDQAPAGSGSPSVQDQETQLIFTEINNGTAYSVSAGTEISDAVVIPATYNGKPVTQIGVEAFFGRTNLASITIPAGVTSIGGGAFSGCTSLTSVTIPEGVTSIGVKAFSSCTNLASITIPASVTDIGWCAFSGCTSLTSITVAADNSNFTSEGGVLYNKDKTTLIQAALGAISGSFTIPDSVTSIGYGAFASCTNLASITIPASVTEISNTIYNGGPPNILYDGAFSGTAWLNNQPDGLVYAGKVLYGYKGTMPANTIINNIRADTVSIAGGAFNERRNLTRITIPASVRYIGRSAFGQHLGLITVIFERGSRLETIASDAFYHCDNLASITIPEGVTVIGSNAFFYCRNLASITIPASVTSVGYYAFGAWLYSQTIYVQGKDQTEADKAWGVDWRMWRYYLVDSGSRYENIDARIVYQR